MSTDVGSRLFDTLRDAVVELAGVPADHVTIDRPLKDLGIDSLVALELVVRMERQFGVRLTEDEIRNIRTIRDIVECAAGRSVA